MPKNIKDHASMLAVYGLRASGDRKQDEETLSKAVYKATDCGAWAKLHDDGVEVGSIVEGSDTEIGPFYMKYPLTLKEWRDTISEVEDEADFAWRRAEVAKNKED